MTNDGSGIYRNCTFFTQLLNMSQRHRKSCRPIFNTSLMVIQRLAFLCFSVIDMRDKAINDSQCFLSLIKSSSLKYKRRTERRRWWFILINFVLCAISSLPSSEPSRHLSNILLIVDDWGFSPGERNCICNFDVLVLINGMLAPKPVSTKFSKNFHSGFLSVCPSRRPADHDN